MNTVYLTACEVGFALTFILFTRRYRSRPKTALRRASSHTIFCDAVAVFLRNCSVHLWHPLLYVVLCRVAMLSMAQLHSLLCAAAMASAVPSSGVQATSVAPSFTIFTNEMLTAA